MGSITRRGFLKTGSFAALGAVLPRSAGAQQRLVLNDASRLNPTPVPRHWVVRRDWSAEVIEQVRKELREAAAAGRPVVVGAARHSMGGQSLPREGTAMTLDVRRCEPDTAARRFRVHAGTRWGHVIAVLDAIGYSPAVMQSNNDFGVAGTFSVNAHGWPVPYAPFGDTVHALRLMLADGTVLTCSRNENAELFALAMGGYGLLGIILDLEVEMIENLLLRPTYEVMPGREVAGRFIQAIGEDPSVRMAYGRLSVARAGFLDEALLVTYRPEPAPAGGLPRAGTGGIVSSVSREIYRAQIGSEAGKRARWLAETVAGPRASSGIATRNTLMNEPVANLAGRHRRRTDILHEYFVPPERFGDFIEACQEVIPRSRQELLNVTLRYVAADATSVLAYAPTRRIAAVMSFSQEMTKAAEADMGAMTRALIDRVSGIGGSFYLPYRLHARRDQVEKVYPRMARFAVRKRHYDPGLLFRNALWDAYLGG
jgi:FAD/FMN-containing dehydrogenase